MLRRVTALTFIAAMLSMLALKHPALAFCTSKHQIVSISECALPNNLTSDHQGCCENCDSKSSKDSLPCTISITFDSDDFLSLDSQNLPSLELSLLPPVQHEAFLAKAVPSKINPPQNTRQNAPPPWQPTQAITGIYLL